MRAQIWLGLTLTCSDEAVPSIKVVAKSALPEPFTKLACAAVKAAFARQRVSTTLLFSSPTGTTFEVEYAFNPANPFYWRLK